MRCRPSPAPTLNGRSETPLARAPVRADTDSDTGSGSATATVTPVTPTEPAHATASPVAGQFKPSQGLAGTPNPRASLLSGLVRRGAESGSANASRIATIYNSHKYGWNSVVDHDDVGIASGTSRKLRVGNSSRPKTLAPVLKPGVRRPKGLRRDEPRPK